MGRREKLIKASVFTCSDKAFLQYWGLMLFEIENEDQRKAALIELALCLTLLRCDHLNSSLNASKCVESFVQNGNPRCYFVATTDKSFVKDLLELPGVAVISVKRGGKLVLKDASLSQKKFAEKNTNESRKRKMKRMLISVMKASSVKAKLQTAKLQKKTDAEIANNGGCVNKEPHGDHQGCKKGKRDPAAFKYERWNGGIDSSWLFRGHENLVLHGFSKISGAIKALLQENKPKHR
ncbi:rRNA-processing protein UTP23 [Tanacetum coccineum]